MPSEFTHELGNAKVLFETLAGDLGIPSVVVEKDYWVMHCLWGLRPGCFHPCRRGNPQDFRKGI
jgi:hypothetical protein